MDSPYQTLIKSKIYPYNYITHAEYVKERLMKPRSLAKGIPALTLPNMNVIK